LSNSHVSLAEEFGMAQVSSISHNKIVSRGWKKTLRFFSGYSIDYNGSLMGILPMLTA